MSIWIEKCSFTDYTIKAPYFVCVEVVRGGRVKAVWLELPGGAQEVWNHGGMSAPLMAGPGEEHDITVEWGEVDPMLHLCVPQATP